MRFAISDILTRLFAELFVLTLSGFTAIVWRTFIWDTLSEEGRVSVFVYRSERPALAPSKHQITSRLLEFFFERTCLLSLHYVSLFSVYCCIQDGRKSVLLPPLRLKLL